MIRYAACQQLPRQFTLYTGGDRNRRIDLLLSVRRPTFAARIRDDKALPYTSPWPLYVPHDYQPNAKAAWKDSLHNLD